MGMGKVGKTHRIKGRCRQEGCNQCWDSAEEYAEFSGCDYQNCKIRESKLRLKAKNEANKAINKARLKDKELSVFTNEVPIHREYAASKEEILMIRAAPPVLTFRIMR